MSTVYGMSRARTASTCQKTSTHDVLSRPASVGSVGGSKTLLHLQPRRLKLSQHFRIGDIKLRLTGRGILPQHGFEDLVASHLRRPSSLSLTSPALDTARYRAAQGMTRRSRRFVRPSPRAPHHLKGSKSK